MWRKVTPDDSVLKSIQQFPHCDARILHAPGECEFCDQHPEWQALRIHWGIAFTGWEPDEEKKELPDPATYACGLKSINAWAANRAQPKDEDDDD